MVDKVILSVGAEGGSIIIYRQIEKDVAYESFYFVIQDIGFEEEDIPPSTRRSELYSSFLEVLINLKADKPYLFSLYPTYFDKSYSNDLESIYNLENLDENVNHSLKHWKEYFSKN